MYWAINCYSNWLDELYESASHKGIQYILVYINFSSFAMCSQSSWNKSFVGISVSILTHNFLPLTTLHFFYIHSRWYKVSQSLVIALTLNTRWTLRCQSRLYNYITDNFRSNFLYHPPRNVFLTSIHNAANPYNAASSNCWQDYVQAILR